MMMWNRQTFRCVLLAWLSQASLAQDGSWQDSYNLDFSYDPEAANGPDAWGDVNGVGPWEDYNNLFVTQGGNQCDSGTRPSPIHLEQMSMGCPDIFELLTRQVSDGDCRRSDLTFDVTPYALRASFPMTEDSCTRPSLTVSGRFSDYSLLWMELHARSEHVIEGKRYDAELQMIHAGTGVEEGQLLGVSILIEATAAADDLEFEWLLQQWEGAVASDAADCGSSRQLRQVSDFQLNTNHKDDASRQHQDREVQEMNPSPCATDRFGGGCEPLGPRRRMYPYNLFPSIWYYGYQGSLTTPPCTSIVEWRIIDQPRQISRRQYKQLSRLLTQSRDSSCAPDTAVNPKTGENYRPLQPRSQQFFQGVFRCTFDDFGYFVYSPEDQ